MYSIRRVIVARDKFTALKAVPFLNKSLALCKHFLTNSPSEERLLRLVNK